ncbi:MAG: TIGR00159 family protein [Deltaproteobacteria bacterium]|nr:TIGR00159 family protein [Deltaproteobacteria bacterium]
MIELIWRTVHDAWTHLAASYDPVRDTLDILVVTVGVYWLLRLIRGTRAVQILVGLLLLIGTSALAQLFQLTTLIWIFDHFLSSAVLIIIVLFQHDIRRMLARVGRGVSPSAARRQETQLLEEVARAAQTLAQKRVGGLIVLERDTNLDDQAEGGLVVDAAVSKELLVSLFLPYSPLHDGAVLIQGGRVARAGCILPLSERQDLPQGLGTRHRAALGLAEETDAVVVVVSEETSEISIVAGGELRRGLDPVRLRAALREALSAARDDVGDGRDAAAGAGASDAGADAQTATTGTAGARSAG